MLIAKLSIRYERGRSRNDDKDLGVEKIERQTADGKIIAGLGTHFKSQDDRDAVKLRDKEAARIREEFKKRFPMTPLDGCYTVPERGVAKKFLSGLGIREDVRAHVSEFKLESEGMDQRELNEWAKRIKNQINTLQYGRKKETDSDALNALEYLSNCPVIAKATGQHIRELVAAVRNEKLTKLDLRRRLDVLDVQVDGDQILSPRRAPALA